MKRYSESCSEPVLDWTKILKQCVAKKTKLSDAQREQANSWETCVCGQLPERLERDHDGEPYDAILRHAGQAWTSLVMAEDYASALTLMPILHRHAIAGLKKEMKGIEAKWDELDAALKLIG